MPEFDPRELIGEFQDEARSQLDRLDAALLHLDREGRMSEDDREEIQRSLHTMKGNAAMVGLGPLRDFVHEIESAIRHREHWPRELIDGLFAAAATARQVVDRVGTEDPETVMAGLRPPDLDEGPDGEPHSDSRRSDPSAEDEASSSIESAAAGLRAEAASETVRVRSAQLDSMLEEVGEIIALRVRMNEWLRSSRTALKDAGLLHDARDHVERLEIFSERIRESVMELRTVPAQRILQRFLVLGRDLAAEQGKRVRIELSGERTQLDKNVLEGLAEPLLHLVRNAVDHGIEDPDERARAGKDPEGLIRITTTRLGDVVEIVVEDDGRGLDLEAIRASAVERGLDLPAHASDREALQRLIFQTGFSTREEVTDISGRGVGLDVVRSRIRSLRGNVVVEPREGGVGARFTLRIPVSMAILPTLLFELGDEPLAVSAGEVVETLRRPHLEWIGKTPTVRHQEQDVPLLDLGALFGWEIARRETPPFAVLLQASARMIAIPADRMIEHRRAVVRPVPAPLGQLQGVSGATVLPSGRPALLLDAAGISDLSLDHQEAAR